MIYVLRQWQNGNINGVCSHLERHRVPYRVVEAWQVEALPPVARGDAVLALGGPPSVCRLRQPDYDVPFLLREAAWLDEVRRQGVVVMGICLGHQLAAAMRDNVVATGRLVFGIEPVDTTLHGRDHWLFAGVPRRFWVYQHHRDSVRTCRGGQVLASSETCAVEAVAWDDCTVSTQFHPEVLQSELRGVIEKYASYVEAAGGADALLARVPSDYETTTCRIFDNFLYRAGAVSRPTWHERIFSVDLPTVGETAA